MTVTGRLWVQRRRRPTGISSCRHRGGRSLPAIPHPQVMREGVSAQGNDWVTYWGQLPHPLASGEQDTLNEYHAKMMHVGQIVVFQRKIKMLSPKEEMDAGQAKTTDVHCSRPAWRVFDEPKVQKPCKDGHTRARALTHTPSCRSLEKGHRRCDRHHSP